MKVYVVKHRHELVGVFRDVIKAADHAEKVVAEATPDPEGLWDGTATISVKDIETDLL